jgi:DNA invertase Pin-like site-specific DNA recombinase
MRTAAYCRFSSDNQSENSIRDQLRNIELYCDRQGWPRPALYQDQAMSGARSDRPGYQAMLGAADLGAFDVLLVDDLSRLSRDSIESAQAIRTLKYNGVRVIGVSDGTDTSRDGYKIETGLRGLMSELYLDDLAKKTHRGLAGQALAGFSAGGLPYGFRSIQTPNGFRREIDEEQARVVRRIFARYAAGASPRQIADELNRDRVPSPRGGTWAHSAIYPDSKGVGMLGNALYVGRQIWNRTAWVKDPKTGRRRRTLRPRSEWIITEHPDLRVIDDETWRACETRAQSSKRDTAVRAAVGKGSGGRMPKYLFSGLLKCGVCGGAFVIQGREHYGCACHKNRGASVCGNGLKVRKSTIERELLAGVKAALLSEDAYHTFESEARTLLREMKPDAGATRRALAAAQRELENIMAAIKAGIVTPSTKGALQEAEADVARLSNELAAIERLEPSQMLPRAREIYRDLVSRLEAIEDVTAARQALRELMGEVRLVPDGDTLMAEITPVALPRLLNIVGSGPPQPVSQERRLTKVDRRFCFAAW